MSADDITTTIERDASGCAVLTAEQAVLVARILCHDWKPSEAGTEEDALWWAFFKIERGKDGCLKPGNKSDALARWVLRWAPVVEAAIKQHDAGEAMSNDNDGEWVDDREWVDACVATETAVGNALNERISILSETA